MKTYLPTRLFALTCASGSILACTAAAFAQTAAVGNITGTVTDTSGAAIPNASVTVIDTDRGVTRVLTTTGAGGYSATFLQPDHYEVIVSAPGFSKVDRKNLLLTVGQVLTIDAQLPTGSNSTEVTVTAETPILDPEKTEVSQTFDPILLANLPVATRNWSAFVLNTPNVVQDGGSGLVSFHGISGLYNQNYVDGSNNNQMLFSEARGRSSGAPYVYSIDSIKEFQAETSNYSVEFGQAAGGQVNAITKSGTNHIHGDLFYYLRYPDMNALDPYSKFSGAHNGGTPLPADAAVHQQHQFGGSIGGPIIKDRALPTSSLMTDFAKSAGPLLGFEYHLDDSYWNVYDEQYRDPDAMPGRRHHRLHPDLRHHRGAMHQRHHLPSGCFHCSSGPLSKAEPLLPAH